MKYELYKAKDGWRWRLKARNGRILADSGEAYSRKGGCRRAVKKIRWRHFMLPFVPIALVGAPSNSKESQQ